MRTILSRCATSPLLLLAIGGVGCTGARHLTEGHLAYNEAVRVASDQELLLNIVRLRYLDSLEFLSISSINSTVSFSVGLDASAGRSGGNSSANAGTAVGYSSTPTFSFVPQRGGQFASRLTEPVDLETLVFIASANRDAHRIFGLLVTWMNGLDNQEGAIDPHFVRATETLTRLQFAGDALFGFREEEAEVTPSLPADQVSASTMLQAIAAGLGVRRQPVGGEITFTRTRRVPTLYVANEATDRETLLEQLRLDPSRTHFPVRDDDAATKRTFFLITQAFRLALDFDTDRAPVLTLPVGG